MKNNKNDSIFLLIIIIIILLLIIMFYYKNNFGLQYMKTKENMIDISNNKDIAVLLKYLEVYEYPIENKLRLGEKSDGGYVIADFGNIYDCYISAGVSTEESFTKDFINKYNLDLFNCFAFDGTIDKYPHHYTKNISFIKKNINNFNDDNNTNLYSLIDKYNNIFLKMDIEGGEYPWLLSLNDTQLNKFKQIVIEVHCMNDESCNHNLNDKIDCFKKLSNNHYLIHAHANNHAGSNNNIPDVLELTYIHKSLYKTEPILNKTKLPIDNLDFPNRIDINDINLSYYPFTN